MPAPAVLLLLGALALPGAPSSGDVSACAATDVKFDVKTINGNHDLPQPDGGKALVVFLQDDKLFAGHPRPTTRYSVDGAWVAATHGDTFNYVMVEPGEHHLCANWQFAGAPLAHARPTSAAHFTAEAGKTYFFVAKDEVNSDTAQGGVVLKPLDSDEGKLLLRSFPRSESVAKK